MEEDESMKYEFARDAIYKKIMQVRLKEIVNLTSQIVNSLLSGIN
jgi:hypothetical protein